MALAAPFPAAGGAPVRTRPAAPFSGLRLTLRGRVVLLFASAAFLLLIIALSGRFPADAGTQVSSQVPAAPVVVVQEGENLWQIAARVAPGTDPREMVAAIRSLNGLGATTVIAGQSIRIPVPSSIH